MASKDVHPDMTLVVNGPTDLMLEFGHQAVRLQTAAAPASQSAAKSNQSAPAWKCVELSGAQFTTLGSIEGGTKWSMPPSSAIGQRMKQSTDEEKKVKQGRSSMFLDHEPTTKGIKGSASRNTGKKIIRNHSANSPIPSHSASSSTFVKKSPFASVIVAESESKPSSTTIVHTPRTSSSTSTVDMKDVENKLLHLLACRPFDVDDCVVKTNLPHEKILTILQKIGSPQASNPKCFQLRPESYKNLHPWKYEYTTDERTRAIRNAGIAFDTLRLPRDSEERKRLVQPDGMNANGTVRIKRKMSEDLVKPVGMHKRTRSEDVRKSGGETLEGRKKMDVISESRSVGGASPKITAGSPYMSAASPRVSAASPRVSAASPKVTAASPRVSAASPKVTAASPKVSVASPRIPVASPKIPASTLKVPAPSPKITAPSPKIPAAALKASTPKITAATPKIAAASPKIVAASPKIVAASPKIPAAAPRAKPSARASGSKSVSQLLAPTTTKSSDSIGVEVVEEEDVASKTADATTSKKLLDANEWKNLSNPDLSKYLSYLLARKTHLQSTLASVLKLGTDIATILDPTMGADVNRRTEAQKMALIKSKLAKTSFQVHPATFIQSCLGLKREYEEVGSGIEEVEKWVAEKGGTVYLDTCS